jgi:L-fuconolactonase
MTIDSHQHFWKYDPERDGWITNEMHKIKRDFMPEDLKPLLDENKIAGCVAVQADQSETETEFLLRLANDHEWIKGVVGWVDLLADDAEQRLDLYKKHLMFKGVRHILQAEPDGFISNPRFIKGVSLLSKRNLTYDILTHEKQLLEVLTFINKLPKMNLVIDHISKPYIKNRSFKLWSSHMKEVSTYEHVCIKLSGMVTEANWSSWTIADLRPYVDFCLENFSADRLMFGSDWPVSLLAGSYKKITDVFLESISKLSAVDQRKIMGGTAVKFYNIN